MDNKTYSPISSNTIELESSTKATIYNVRLSVVCNECGNTWGVSLNQEGKLPFRWDTCIACSRKVKTILKELV